MEDVKSYTAEEIEKHTKCAAEKEELKNLLYGYAKSEHPIETKVDAELCADYLYRKGYRRLSTENLRVTESEMVALWDSMVDYLNEIRK